MMTVATSPAMPSARLAFPRLLHRVFVTLVICLVVSVFLSTAFGLWWPRTIVYSLAIGLSCHAFIDSGRALAARALDRFVPGRVPRDGWPGWPVMAVCVVVGALAGLALGSAIGDALVGQPSIRLLPRDLRSAMVLLLISLSGSVVAAGYYFARKRVTSTQSQAPAAQCAAGESELRLIQSQLEPHMLFNTLANLRALIAADPPRAQAMLDRLVSFLRATLGASRTALHPLAAEFDRLADYLALTGIRMGPRLQARLVLPAELREHPVPPLLLQPLVENSIKHGLEPRVSGGTVIVLAERDGDSIVLSVRDTGAGLRPPRGGGTRYGLQQVHERLAAQYGTRARFTLEAASDGGTLARIVIPMESP
jgi:hypothetical protein